MFGKIAERRALSELRKIWPEHKTHGRDNKSLAAYFASTAATYEKGIVDDKTWHDLDLSSIFHSLDSTSSSVGQQYLYYRLRVLNQSVKDLKRQHELATFMRKNHGAREQIQLSLRHMGLGDASPVTRVLFANGALTSLSKVKILGWATFSLALLALLFLWPSPIWLILLVVTNFLVSRHFEIKTDQATYTLSYFYKLVCVAERMVKVSIPEDISAVRELRDNKKEIRRVKKLLYLVSINQNSDSLIVSNFMYLVNLVFPYDWVVYHFSLEFMLKRLQLLRRCYLSIGEIDSSISMASYLERNTRLCNPDLVECDSMEFQNAYHPLVKNCVSNSVACSGTSALVTGSNMAGKTTFIKTLGVNFILSQTFWICHADRAKIPSFDIYTCIKTADSLEHGKSFYFSELERIKLFLNRSGNRRCLLLIDEIFRGTNTIERIAGAAAVIDELLKSNIVIVTTHDTELATILKEKIDLYHFEETGDPNVPFDYKLKFGVCRTRNALKLMSNLGYPKHVVNNAVQLSAKIAGLSSVNAVENVVL